MLSKAEIYHWFKELPAWSRIDFISSMIRLCNPFELKFIGSYIDDIVQVDYVALMDQEAKANNSQNLEQLLRRSPPVAEFQSHIAVCISLLQSRNHKVGAKIAEVLEKKVEALNMQRLMEPRCQSELDLWMLLLALASYHPAFNFNKQLKFKKKLTEYEGIQRRENQVCRPCHFSQKQRLPSNRELLDNEQASSLHPTALPFPQYPSHHKPRYTEYSNKSYQPQGQMNNGFARYPSMRPNMPATVISPYVMEAYYTPGILSTPTNSLVNSDGQIQGDVYVPSNEICHPLPGATWNNPAVGNGFPSRSSTSGGNEDAQLPNRSLQFTVSQPTTFTNVTNVLPVSTVVTTSATNSFISCRQSFEKTPTAVSSQSQNCTDTTGSFITIPTSTTSETLSNKVCYEIKTNQICKNRNRSQSGDTSSNRQRKAETVAHFSAQPLRSSTSAPVLATIAGQKSSNGTGSNNKTSQLAINTKIKQSPRPMNVFVTSKGRNASYRFEITWTDGTTSECYHTVQDIILFYKQVTSKLRKSSAQIDALAKQNNQGMDRSLKLQNIFSNFINNCVNDSNIESILQFFKHNMPPPMAQLKKRFRSASKSRQIVDGSSSSSSTASPPLANSTKTKILQSSLPRIMTSSSLPAPTKTVTSASSVRSSSSSIATTNAEETAESSLDDKNDPCRKPLDIDSTSSLTTQQKTNLKDDGVVGQSEDERSSSSQSGPVTFANCSTPDIAIGDSRLSFELEGPGKDEKTFLLTQSNEFQHGPTEFQDADRNADVKPSCAYSQGGANSVSEVPSRPRYYFNPNVPITRYYTGPYETPQRSPQSWYPRAFNQPYIPPNAYSVTPNVSTQTSAGNMAVRTVSSPVYSRTSEPSHHAYNETAPELTQACDIVTSSHLHPMRQPHSEMPHLQQNRDNWSSTASSDADSSIRHHSDLITAESLTHDLPPTAYQNRSYYAASPRYGGIPHYVNVSRTSHPLAPSYSESTIYQSQTLRNFKKSEHSHHKLTSSNSVHVMNGYPENRSASRRMHQDTNRSHFKRHNYGDGPKRGYVLHCCYCGRKGHDSTACRNLNATDNPKSDFQQDVTSSRRPRTNK